MKKLSAGRLINELSRASHIYFQREFRKYRIGYAQIRTLYYVAKNPGSTQKELALDLNLDKSSITSQLQILEQNGYIIRGASDTDARKQTLGISDKTREILPSLQNVLETWTEILLKGFTENERDQIVGFLTKMLSNAEHGMTETGKQPQ